MIKILGMSGSTRKDSFNKKTLKIALAGAEKAGAQITNIDLRDYALPFYDGDLEASAGVPPVAMELKTLFKTHQGFIFSSPEYNSSFSAVLKNVIDWLSRPVPDEKMLECFNGKVVALLSASPGALGGLRGLMQLRMVLSNINMLVIPEQIAINHADKAFDEKHQLIDPKKHDSVFGLGAKLVEMVNKIHHQ